MKRNYFLSITLLALFLLSTGSAFGQSYVLNENFESETFPPKGWTVTDHDNDGHCWQSVTSSDATVNGKKGAISYTTNPTVLNDPYGMQDNYLITPPINITNEAFVLSFKYAAQDLETDEKMEIRVSKTGTDVADFTDLLYEETVSNGYDDYVSLKSFNRSLSAYKGEKIYIAFVHKGSGTYALGIDDVTVANQKGPKPVTGMTVTAGEKGALSATLSWKNPAENATGDPLSEIAIGIYRDNLLIKALSENIVAGETSTYTDNSVTTGTHIYSIIAKTSEGESKPVSKSAYIGEDIPAAVNNLNAVIRNGKTSITWEAPTAGINKGYINPDNITYTIVRNTADGETQLATDLKKLNFEEAVGSGILHSYTVTPVNKAGKGTPLISNGVISFAQDFTEIIAGANADAQYVHEKLPADVTSRASVTESIYYPEDFMYATGEIKHLIYKNGFGPNTEITKPIKIWMGETDKANLSEGWIPTNELTLVFDGNIQFKKGTNDIPVALSTPYNYTGKNLVIIFQMDFVKASGSYVDRFFVASTPDKADRSRAYTAYDNIDVNALAASKGSRSAEIPLTRFVLNAKGVSKLEGTVKDNVTNDPITGAILNIPELNLSTSTDENGAYNFDIVRTGTQQIKIAANGYIDATEEVAIPDGGKLTKDFMLTPKPTFSISGSIKANDTEAAITGAIIKVTGYAEKETTSNADGTFVLPGVYAGESYTLSIENPLYDIYTVTLQDRTEDYNIGEVTLNRSLIPAYGVTATIDPDGAYSTITWQDPLSRTGNIQWTKWGDSDIQKNTNGDYNATDYNVAHAFDSKDIEDLSMVGLSFMKLKVYLKATEGTFTAKIWKGTREEPIELAAKVIPAEQVSEDGSWVTVTFDEPIEIRKGESYLVGVNCKDASDSPIGVAGYGSDIEGKNNLKWSDDPYTYNGYYAYNISAYCGIPGTEVAVNATASAPKCNYNVYRAEKSDLTQWTRLNASPLQTFTYTDDGWDELLSGKYLYSVKAIYKTGESIGAYSDTIKRSVDYDAGISEFISPVKMKDPQTSVEVKVRIKNFGEKPLTSIPVSYRVNDGTAVNKVYEGNLAKGETAEFSLGTVDVAGLGSYEFRAYTQLENDGSPANDEKVFVLPNYEDVKLYGYRWDAYGNAGIVRMHSNIPEQTTFVKEVTPDDALINAGEYYNGRYYAYTSTWYSEPRQFIEMDTITWIPTKSATTEDFMQDMAYDYSSHMMYGIRVNGDQSELVTINLTNGQATSVGNTGKNLHALACNKEGVLYGISDQGELCTLDKTAATPDVIGNTGIEDVAYLQSMAFDHNTGRLFWAHTGGQILGNIYEIDPATAQITPLGSAISKASPSEIIGMYTVYTDPGTNTCNVKAEKTLNVYTDEAKNIHVLLPLGSNEQATIRIVNTVGEIVKVQDTQESETVIHSNLPAGVYFATVTTADGATYKMSFLIR